jgi:hypothetical protein
MGLLPTHRDESPLLRFIDSKQVTRDFRRSVIACLRQLSLGFGFSPGSLITRFTKVTLASRQRLRHRLCQRLFD